MSVGKAHDNDDDDITEYQQNYTIQTVTSFCYCIKCISQVLLYQCISDVLLYQVYLLSVTVSSISLYQMYLSEVLLYLSQVLLCPVYLCEVSDTTPDPKVIDQVPSLLKRTETFKGPV